MRTPTTLEQALDWHTRALKDLEMRLPIMLDDTFDPQCGWFLARQSRGGPLVPARIYLEQEVCPETGNLLSDEVLKCEINGREYDPEEQFPYLCGEPITEQAYNYLMARKDFTETYAPHEPAANPFKKVDWGNVPTPTF